jgi:hypothetical protein
MQKLFFFRTPADEDKMTGAIRMQEKGLPGSRLLPEEDARGRGRY